MRHSEIIALVSAAALGVGALGFGRYVAGEIEQELGERTREQLEVIGFSGVSVDVDGMVLALSGRINTENDREILIATLESMRNVDAVIDNLVLVSPLVELQPAALFLQKDDAAVTLSGEAPNAAARDLLAARAELARSGGAFYNLMKAQDRKAPDQWLAAAEAAIDAVAALRVGQASVERGVVRVVGAAPDARAKDRIAARLQSRVDPTFSLTIDISAPPPLLSPYVFSASKSATLGLEIARCAAPDAQRRSVILGELKSRGVRITGAGSAGDVCIVANGAPDQLWTDAVVRALGALKLLEEGEARIVDDRVSIDGLLPNDADFDAVRAAAKRDWPPSYTVSVFLQNELPVASPYMLTAVKRAGSAQLSGNAPNRDRAAEWGRRLGARSNLTLARGAPTGWVDAVEVLLDVLEDLPVGAATFNDTEVTLSAPGNIGGRARLQDSVGSALPPGFTLRVTPAHEPTGAAATNNVASTLSAEGVENVGGELNTQRSATLSASLDSGDAPIEQASARAASTVTAAAPKGPPLPPPDVAAYSFTARKHGDGSAELSGVVGSDYQKRTVSVLAGAKLGRDRMSETLLVGQAEPPLGWQSALFASLQALGGLYRGEVVARPGAIILRGSVENAAQIDEVTALLREKTPEDFENEVELDVLAPEPTLTESTPTILSPEACVEALNAEVTENPILFETGRDVVDPSSYGAVERLSELLKTCPDARIEIASHTDALGTDEWNLQISERRARIVRWQMKAAGVDASRLVPKGYGEAEPIADNSTKAGQAKNRRIAFKLIE